MIRTILFTQPVMDKSIEESIQKKPTRIEMIPNQKTNFLAISQGDDCV
jgi:hypothetical protein